MLTVRAWAAERLANSERIASMKIGEDRRGWLEDVAYWMEIAASLDLLEELKALSGLGQWRCRECGCLWREWPDVWSLWDAHQKPCLVCDNSPQFRDAIERVKPTSQDPPCRQA